MNLSVSLARLLLDDVGARHVAPATIALSQMSNPFLRWRSTYFKTSLPSLCGWQRCLNFRNGSYCHMLFFFGALLKLLRHGLTKINIEFPVFVLAFCTIQKKHYAEAILPALTEFKFKHFGHDMQVLHEHDIRKEKNGFRFKNRQEKDAFMAELGCVINQSNFTLICAVINKQLLKERYSKPNNPYHLALEFCLERLFYFMREKDQQEGLTHLIVENRGKKEDRQLEKEFQRVCGGDNRHQRKLPFNLIFANKKTNSPGLQLADLVARPIGLKTFRPEQENKAFATLEKKLYCNKGSLGAGSSCEGYGLKYFP